MMLFPNLKFNNLRIKLINCVLKILYCFFGKMRIRHFLGLSKDLKKLQNEKQIFSVVIAFLLRIFLTSEEKSKTLEADGVTNSSANFNGLKNAARETSLILVIIVLRRKRTSFPFV